MKVGSLGISAVCSAFEHKTVGSKVTDVGGFISALNEAISAHHWSTCKTPGQAYLKVDAADYVSAGVGRNTDNPKDYVLRAHRGKVSAYLKRELALPTVNVHAVVYTEEAYMNDPQVDMREFERMQAHRFEFGHGERFVLVAVLADAGTPSTRSPYRFVDCLAGGNNEADAWTMDDVRRMAREIIENTNEFGVVAD